MEKKSKIIYYLFSLEQHLDIYYKTVEEHLECPTWVRKKFMELLKNDIADYVDENPDATMEDICTVFGDPFEPNNELLRVLEREYLKKLKRRLVICYGLIGGLMLLLIAMLIILLHYINNSSLLIRISDLSNKN